MTEHSDEVFGAVKKHCGIAKFSSMEGLMDYALNEMDQKHGTHIFIGDVKLNVERLQGDIRINKLSEDVE